jgi:Ti type entry exclusion protein TrbK
MVKKKLIIGLVAVALALGSAGVWLLISEKQAAQERRAKFFGSSKSYPTSGGEKMKMEW